MSKNKWGWVSPLIIIGGVVGAGYLLYKYVLEPLGGWASGVGGAVSNFAGDVVAGAGQTADAISEAVSEQGSNIGEILTTPGAVIDALVNPEPVTQYEVKDDMIQNVETVTDIPGAIVNPVGFVGSLIDMVKTAIQVKTGGVEPVPEPEPIPTPTYDTGVAGESTIEHLTRLYQAHPDNWQLKHLIEAYTKKEIEAGQPMEILDVGGATYLSGIVNYGEAPDYTITAGTQTIGVLEQIEQQQPNEALSKLIQNFRLSTGQAK